MFVGGLIRGHMAMWGVLTNLILSDILFLDCVPPLSPNLGASDVTYGIIVAKFGFFKVVCVVDALESAAVDYLPYLLRDSSLMVCAFLECWMEGIAWKLL